MTDEKQRAGELIGVGSLVRLRDREGTYRVTAMDFRLNSATVQMPGKRESIYNVPFGAMLSADHVPAASAKPTNPKDLLGSNKVPMHLWPTTATAMGSIALLNGALKYGRSNWREAGVRASIYYDAAMRHLMAWFEGEECDPDDGVPHLAAALGCLAIIVDAEAAGKLEDDRAHVGGLRALMERLTPEVARLKAHHAGKDPKHYTIKDRKDAA